MEHVSPFWILAYIIKVLKSLTNQDSIVIRLALVHIISDSSSNWSARKIVKIEPKSIPIFDFISQFYQLWVVCTIELFGACKDTDLILLTKFICLYVRCKWAIISIWYNLLTGIQDWCKLLLSYIMGPKFSSSSFLLAFYCGGQKSSKGNASLTYCLWVARSPIRKSSLSPFL